MLAAAGLARIGQMRHVPTGDLIAMPDAGEYARYGVRTAARLLELCEIINERYDGQVAVIGRRFAACLAVLAAACGLDVRDLEAGLARLDVAHGRAMASCPGGQDCTAVRRSAAVIVDIPQ
jgi:hypothetical protein